MNRRLQIFGKCEAASGAIKRPGTIPEDDMSDNTPATGFAKDQLRAIVERVETLEEERRARAEDISEVYAEAKGNGYDVKALRAVVAIRRKDADERAEAETILETYMQALGML
jgi:uncharacterized protein (UPF0335 family)